jgi:carbonic anhydrase
MSMKEVIRGLSEFHTKYFCTHQEMFSRLSQGQAPQILFITCSESRMLPDNETIGVLTDELLKSY